MNVDELIDAAADLPIEGVVGLGLLAAVLVVLAAGVQYAAWGLHRELATAEEELVDQRTGLLPRSAVPVRLGAELSWSVATDTPISVAAMRIRGSRFTHAARVLRHAMRGEEQAFLLGDQRVAVELWGTGPDAAADATRRLGDALQRAGHPVVDAGVASAPRDGMDTEDVIAAALRDLRPVDDPQPPGHELGRDGTARSPVGRAGALLWAVLPWFVAQVVLLATTWRLLPAAIEPALDGASRTGGDVLVALVATLGLPLGAALLHLAGWNLGGGRAPSSHPHGPAHWSVAAGIFAIVGVPLAWGIFAPSTPDLDGGEALGAMLAMLALVVLVLLSARQLVGAVAAVLVTLVLLGGGVTWLAVEQLEMPLVANGGRLLFAAALGALLARYIERASWLVGLAALAAGVDLWSVYSDSGVTSSLLDTAGSGSGSDRVLDLLLFTGPVVGGAPLFQLGVTDLVFVALFVAWAHDWRLDMRIVTGLLVAASWVALVLTVTLDEAVPVLPALAVTMLLLLVGRSVVLRTRNRTWRRTAAE